MNWMEFFGNRGETFFFYSLISMEQWLRWTICHPQIVDNQKNCEEFTNFIKTFRPAESNGIKVSIEFF